MRRILEVVVVILCTVPLVRAQASSPKFQVAVGYSRIHLDSADQLDITEPGISTRVGYTVSGNLGVEAELNVFPRDLGVFSRGMVQGLFGPTIGWRAERVGLFGKVRPGFLKFREQREPFPCPAVVPPPLACVIGGQTEFALDLGGVVEVYAHRRIVLRMDVGDTLVRFDEPVLRLGQPGPDGIVPSTVVEGFWDHNIQFATSIGFRF